MGKRRLETESAEPQGRDGSSFENEDREHPAEEDSEEEDDEEEEQELEEEKELQVEEDEKADEEDDDEEEENIDHQDDEEEIEVLPEHKSKKQKLSAQDVQVARETAELFKSNIFKLQIDELLKEIKIKESYITKIEKVLHRIHEIITLVPATPEDLTLEQAQKLVKKCVIPFADPKPTKINYNLAYAPPVNISIVGSFGLKSGIAGSVGSHDNSIDVSLTMPPSILHPKDYLNYRALHKRAFYLAYLADQLIPLSKKHNLPIKIAYHYLNNDVLCPILKITSINTNDPQDLVFHKTKFSINLVVAFPHGIFDSKKLLPDKNCIRIETADNSGATLPPTPLYNSSILSMCSYDYYLKYLYTTKKITSAFKDACILGRLWLRNNGMSSDIHEGGFGHFEFAILMSTLLNGGGLQNNKILLHGFSSYQLFRGTVKYLATMDLSKGYLSFSSLIGENITAKYNPEGFNVPTIFDKNIRLNVLWKMTRGSYTKLQAIASQTLSLLSDVVNDRFDSILLQNSNILPLKYDMVFDIEIPNEIELESFGPLEKITFLTFENYIKNRLFLILSTALGSRATQIYAVPHSVNATFPLIKRKPSAPGSSTFKIALELNPDESEKLVTKGPSNDEDETEEAETAKFRSFWGKKASLRRFKDGTIQHCVVWAMIPQEPIVVSIVKFALDSHLYPDSSSHLTYSNALNRLQQPLTNANNGITSMTNFTNVKNSFESLNKVLMNLELPLGVKSITIGHSTSLRSTSILQPIPFAISQPNFWNELIVQFESSARWPDELSNLENAKTAFLLKMHNILSEKSIYRTFISKDIDEKIPFNKDVCLLNILTPEGFGFRVRLLTERDEALYLRAVNNSSRDKALVQDIYLKFNQTYIGAVKHSRTITQLSAYFSFYSGTVRLFKSWLDAQLLLCHFSDELIELLAIKPFVDPAPFTAPHSIENGFLQIINYLANWNWKEDPLILDLVKPSAAFDEKLSDRLTIQNHRLITSNFDKIRKVDPLGIKTQLFVASKDDPSGILWSQNLSLPIATRLTALSRIATNMVKESSIGLTPEILSVLFTPVTEDYDFIINVKISPLVGSSGTLPPNKFKNLVAGVTSFPADLTAKYDLIHVLYKDLNKKYGNVAIFSTKTCSFADDGRNIITGLFIPSSLSKKKFRANLNINVRPLEGDEVVINKDAIFDQMKLLGGDLIESIERK